MFLKGKRFLALLMALVMIIGAQTVAFASEDYQSDVIAASQDILNTPVTDLPGLQAVVNSLVNLIKPADFTPETFVYFSNAVDFAQAILVSTQPLPPGILRSTINSAIIRFEQAMERLELIEPSIPFPTPGPAERAAELVPLAAEAARALPDVDPVDGTARASRAAYDHANMLIGMALDAVNAMHPADPMRAIYLRTLNNASTRAANVFVVPAVVLAENGLAWLVLQQNPTYAQIANAYRLISEARLLVNAMPDSPLKSELLGRLAVAGNRFEEITTGGNQIAVAVAEAERLAGLPDNFTEAQLTQAIRAISDARELVWRMANSPERRAFEDRLNVAEYRLWTRAEGGNIGDLLHAVRVALEDLDNDIVKDTPAERARIEVLIANAATRIGQMADSMLRRERESDLAYFVEWFERLTIACADVMQAVEDAVYRANNFPENHTEADIRGAFRLIEEAKYLVNKLADSPQRTSLLARLDEASITLHTRLYGGVGSVVNEAVRSAEWRVAWFKNIYFNYGRDFTDIERLVVERYLHDARVLVDAMANTPYRRYLNNRLQIADFEFRVAFYGGPHVNTAVNNAVHEVRYLRNNPSQAEQDRIWGLINEAQLLVNQMAASPQRRTLHASLEAARQELWMKIFGNQRILDAIWIARQALEELENKATANPPVFVDQRDIVIAEGLINEARSLVDDMVDSDARRLFLRDVEDFSFRLDVLATGGALASQAVLEAETAVFFLIDDPSTEQIARVWRLLSEAQFFVDRMANTVTRTRLQNRIDDASLDLYIKINGCSQLFATLHELGLAMANFRLIPNPLPTDYTIVDDLISDVRNLIDKMVNSPTRRQLVNRVNGYAAEVEAKRAGCPLIWAAIERARVAVNALNANSSQNEAVNASNLVDEARAMIVAVGPNFVSSEIGREMLRILNDLENRLLPPATVERVDRAVSAINALNHNSTQAQIANAETLLLNARTLVAQVLVPELRIMLEEELKDAENTLESTKQYRARHILNGAINTYNIIVGEVRNGRGVNPILRANLVASMNSGRIAAEGMNPAFYNAERVHYLFVVAELTTRIARNNWSTALPWIP
jgi:hypothetical protein